VYSDAEETNIIEFLKSYFAVNSRNFDLHEENLGKVLIPIVDLINSDLDNINSDYLYDQKTEEFVVTAIKDIKKDEEIIIDYGLMGNNELLLNYGFTNDKTSNESQVQIHLTNGEIIFMSKQNINVSPNAYFIQDNDKEDNSPIVNLVKFSSFIRDIIINYKTNMKVNNDLLLNEEKMSIKDLNSVRVLIEEQEIIYNAYDVLNALIYLLTYPQNDQELEKVFEKLQGNKGELFRVIAKHKTEVQNILKQLNFEVLPVLNYDLYLRQDACEFYEDFVDVMNKLDGPVKNKRKRLNKKNKDFE